jgi:hypothetical protein
VKTSPPPIPRKPTGRVAARNAVFANQFATPGLGSLFARRWVAGIGQLLLAVTGFCFVVWWFIALLVQYYRTMDFSQQTQPRPVAWIGWTGAGIFLASWLWALVTSISILREARRNEQAQALAELQRPLSS